MPGPMYLYIDIETAPSHDPALVAELFEQHRVAPLDLSTITAAANLRDEIKIAEDLAKRRAKAILDHDAARVKAGVDFEEAYRKTCLDATTGHIACVSFAVGSDDVRNVENAKFYRYAELGANADDPDLLPLDDVLGGERMMLCKLFVALEAIVDTEAGFFQPTIVVHHAAFDVRYIWQRAIILGVPVPSWWPIDARPWDTDRLDDTMLAWAGHNGRIGLDRLCKALGIPGKPDSIDGSKVWDAIREGRLSNVIDYCDGDVERLRAVHRRIRQQTIEVTTTEIWSNRNGGAQVVETIGGDA